MRLLFTALTAVVLVALLLLVISCGQEAQKNRGSLQGIVAKPAPTVNQAKMRDYGPQRSGTSFRAPQGGYLLVYFGYTSCPDICPTTMADLRLAISDLPAAERTKVTPVFVTVDPSRDTPIKLNSYMKQFFGKRYQARWSNNAVQLKKAEQAFAVSHKKGKVDKTGNYPMSHTSLVYAVNDQGKIVVRWPYPPDPQIITDDLEVLFAQSRAN